MKIDAEYLSHLRFADDTLICANIPHELQQMLQELVDERGSHGLKMNKSKTKVMFKAYRYILPINVQTIFRIHESRYSSRHICKFKQIYVCTNLKNMCISVIEVTLWNTLDNSLICL